MTRDDLIAALRAVAAGSRAPEQAADDLERAGFVQLGFATVDTDRARRRGMPEVVYGAGKTAPQIAAILRTLYARGQRALATRVQPEVAAAALADLADLPAQYDADARCLLIEDAPAPDTGLGTITVVSAGTSDLPVAAEAALTARLCGNRVDVIHDIGVAGLHRLLAHVDRLRASQVVVVVAGMEGALPSVVAGLIDRPVVAVPTSVGYGASFGGLAALLGMLNACASGVTVVNIDNGFGAGVAASLMNRPPR